MFLMGFFLTESDRYFSKNGMWITTTVMVENQEKIFLRKKKRSKVLTKRLQIHLQRDDNSHDEPH